MLLLLLSCSSGIIDIKPLTEQEVKDLSVNLYEADENGTTNFMRACYYDKINLDEIGDVDSCIFTKDYKGRTPLMYSCSGNSSIKWFLEKIQDDVKKYIKIVDADGNSAITYAIESKNIEAIESILSHLAEERLDLLRKENSKKETPLSKAISCEYTMDLILGSVSEEEKQSIIEQPLGDKSDTLLMLAVKEGNDSLVDLLLEKGAEYINRKNIEGDNALMYAIREGMEHIALELLERKVEFNIKNRRGENPLFLSRYNNLTNVSKKLVSLGAVELKEEEKEKVIRLHREELPKYFESIVSSASEYSREDVLSLELIKSVKSKNIEKTKYLLDNGADADRSYFSYTYLNYHGRVDQMDVYTEELIKEKEEYYKEKFDKEDNEINSKMIRIQDKSEENKGYIRTCLGYSIEAGNKEITRLILESLRDKKQDIRSEVVLEAFNGNINLKNEIPGADSYISEALAYASAGGHLLLVNKLLDEGANINATVERGRTPLMLACAFGNKDVVKELLEKGADLFVKDRWSQKALMYAAQNGDIELVELVLNKIERADYGNLSFDEIEDLKEGLDCKNILIYAVDAGNYDLVKHLLENRNMNPDSFSYGGNTAIIHAVKRRDKAIIKLLVKNNADIDLGDSEDSHPICKAIERGYKDMVDCLIKENCCLEAISEYEETALVASIRFGNLGIIRMLSQEEDLINKECEEDLPLINAAWEDISVPESVMGYVRREIVKILIDAGAEIDRKSALESTALLLACIRGYYEIAELLIDRGARVDKIYRHRVEPTALYAAVKYKNYEIVKLLLEKRAATDIDDSEGKTPLMCSIKEGSSKISKLLIDSGALLDIEDKKGKTVLMYAAEQGDREIIEILIGREVDLEKRDEEGRTAIDYADHNTRILLLSHLDNKRKRAKRGNSSK